MEMLAYCDDLRELHSIGELLKADRELPAIWKRRLAEKINEMWTQLIEPCYDVHRVQKLAHELMIHG